MICFSVVTYQWRVFHSLEFGTQRPYQNYNNNNMPVWLGQGRLPCASVQLLDYCTCSAYGPLINPPRPLGKYLILCLWVWLYELYDSMALWLYGESIVITYITMLTYILVSFLFFLILGFGLGLKIWLRLGWGLGLGFWISISDRWRCRHSGQKRLQDACVRSGWERRLAIGTIQCVWGSGWDAVWISGMAIRMDPYE